MDGWMEKNVECTFSWPLRNDVPHQSIVVILPCPLSTVQNSKHILSVPHILFLKYLCEQLAVLQLSSPVLTIPGISTIGKCGLRSNSSLSDKPGWNGFPSLPAGGLRKLVILLINSSASSDCGNSAGRSSSARLTVTKFCSSSN